MSAIERVEHALADVAAGRAVIVVDDVHRGGEGQLIFAAEKATSESMAFTVRHTSGFVSVALDGATCDRLALPPMRHGGTASQINAGHIDYVVAVDAREGIGTGISGADRARTAALLANPDASALDFTRPGHVLPARARSDGVLDRPGPAEAAVDLTRLAGLRPAGVFAGIVGIADPTVMSSGADLDEFALAHGLAVLSITDLCEYRRRVEPQLAREAQARIPTPHGEFRAVGYVSRTDGLEHLAMATGDLDGAAEVQVHVHVESLLADLVDARRLDDALADAAAAGDAVVLYLRSPRRRAASLLDDVGVDDAAVGAVAAEILRDLAVTSVTVRPGDDRTGRLLSAEGITVRSRTEHRPVEMAV